MTSTPFTIDQALTILKDDFDYDYSDSPELITLDQYGFLARNEGLVAAVYILPEHRGKGHGERLMRQAREQHGGPLRLQCRAELAPWYEKLGYTTRFTAGGGEFNYMQQPE